MDFRQFFGDWLLQDAEGNGDGLQVLCSGGHVDVDGLEAGVVDDGDLSGKGETSTKGMRRW